MPMRPFDSGRVRSQAMVSAPSRAFMAEGIKLALGIAAPAHVLNHDVVAMPRKPNWMRIDNGRSDIASIGLAHQQRGMRSRSRRVVMIGNEFDAVGQAAAHAAFEADAIAAIDPIGFAHGVGESG